MRHLVLPTFFIASALKFVGSGSDIAEGEGKRSFVLSGISSPDNGLIQGDGKKQEDILRGKGNL